MENQKGFTLIELLVTIAIIGVLASIVFTLINFARSKAENASFRSSAKSVKSAINVCCVEDGVIQEKTAGAGSSVYICDDTSIIDAQYPGDANIGTVTISSQCDDGEFEVVVTPGIKNSAEGCESITYDETGEISDVGC